MKTTFYLPSFLWTVRGVPTEGCQCHQSKDIAELLYLSLLLTGDEKDERRIEIFNGKNVTNIQQ